MNIKDLAIIDTKQELYAAFNTFILSSESRIFNKLLIRHSLMQKVKNIPGDIVECGVFKGTGIMSFLKIKRLLMPNSHKKVIGFDFFDTKNLLATLTDRDKQTMQIMFDSREFCHKDNFCEELKNLIISCNFAQEEFELVQGDVSVTSMQYIQNKPGFKISLLYMDLDLEKPTYDVLCNFWDRISIGGIVVFDEYAYHNWSETEGVDRFFKNKNVVYNCIDAICPTMYIQKGSS